MTKTEIIKTTQEKQQVVFEGWINDTIADFGYPYLIHEGDLMYDIIYEIPHGWLLDFCQARKDVVSGIPSYVTYCKARQLILDTANAVNLNIETLTTTYGKTAVVDTRRVVWLMLSKLGLTHHQISAITVGDRTSITHGIKKMQDYIRLKDKNVEELLKSLQIIIHKYDLELAL